MFIWETGARSHIYLFVKSTPYVYVTFSFMFLFLKYCKIVCISNRYQWSDIFESLVWYLFSVLLLEACWNLEREGKGDRVWHRKTGKDCTWLYMISTCVLQQSREVAPRVQSVLKLTPPILCRNFIDVYSVFCWDLIFYQILQNIHNSLALFMLMQKVKPFTSWLCKFTKVIKRDRHLPLLSRWKYVSSVFVLNSLFIICSVLLGQNQESLCFRNTNPRFSPSLIIFLLCPLQISMSVLSLIYHLIIFVDIKTHVYGDAFKN